MTAKCRHTAPAAIGAAFISATVVFAALPYPIALDHPNGPADRQTHQRLSTRSPTQLPRQGWSLTAHEVLDFLGQILLKDSTALTATESALLRDLLEGPMKLKRWEHGTAGSMLAINTCAGGELWFHFDARIFTQWPYRTEYYNFYVLDDGETSGLPLDENAPQGQYSKRTGTRYTAWVLWCRDWISLNHIQHRPGLWTSLSTTWESPHYKIPDVRLFPFPWLSVQSTTLEAREAGLWGGIYHKEAALDYRKVRRSSVGMDARAVLWRDAYAKLGVTLESGIGRHRTKRLAADQGIRKRGLVV